MIEVRLYGAGIRQFLSRCLFTIHNFPIFVYQQKVMAKQFEDFDANLTGDEGKAEETRASWFKRIKKGINTKTSEKKETPEGLWVKCPECNFITFYAHFLLNLPDVSATNFLKVFAFFCFSSSAKISSKISSIPVLMHGNIVRHSSSLSS